LFSIQEQAAADDTQSDLRESRQVDDGGHWNNVGYVTSSYNDP
jgi:hypothetical protein